MYSAKLLDHFEHPRNPGEVEAANAIAEVSNPVCGDVVRFSARVVAGRIE
jgi:nitrogen fixation protein NifU and related proteins